MYTIRFLMLFWIFFNIEIPNVNSSTKIKKTIRRIPSDKIVEKDNRNGAEDIFKKFGVGDQNRLCTSIDGKTNHIVAYGICKGVFQKMCGEHRDIEELYKNTISDFNVTIEKVDVQFKIVGFEPTKKHIGKVGKAICESRLDKFHVVHAKGDFYYVSKPDGELLACLNIPLEKKDYPKIVLKPSEHRLEADNIFGAFGTGKFTIPKGTSAKDKTTRDKMCTVAMKKLKLEKQRYNLYTKTKLRRYIPKVCDGCAKETNPLDSLQCFFNDGAYTGCLVILNTPEKNLYYVARKLADDINNPTITTMGYGVFQLMYITPTEMSDIP